MAENGRGRILRAGGGRGIIAPGRRSRFRGGSEAQPTRDLDRRCPGGMASILAQADQAVRGAGRWRAGEDVSRRLAAYRSLWRAVTGGIR